MSYREPKTVRLEDYTPPAFLIDTLALDFDSDAEATTVRAEGRARRNPLAVDPGGDFALDGAGLETLEVSLDGTPLPRDRYTLDAERLVLHDVPETFTFATTVRLRPSGNTSLEGLYHSSGNLCTQCEAQGFRKITRFPDRPDVMSRYTVRLEAARDRYPVLLSNGNAVAAGDLPGDRHWVRWEDRFLKPSYLFALVAGDLACVEDRFVTVTGREVALRIYVEHHNRDRCDHAMAALVKAMRWDEEVYGLEYDLDTYMIVAVDDFNMGAMENKGLNVFNSKYVLARPDTATDADYAAIEGVIAHEYFHNWTGNRVTCRDWFQLSLKEGLTVFRDQEFSADVTARAVKRIQDVRTLRTHQFAEDAGPMAHPVRPDAYIEISNFYTVTVYNKGAEVVRMIHGLLGAAGFRAGMDLYFQRHDGQAVTTEDFVTAMEDATGKDLGQARRWYTQAGTPRVRASGRYDAAGRIYELHLAQSCPPTPGQPDKLPFQIPIRVGLLGPDGAELPVRLEATATPGDGGDMLELREAAQTFRFLDVPAAPVVSLGRGFSAPVQLELDRDESELAFLMAHDSDAFNRWDAAQTYAVRVIYRLVEARANGRALAHPEAFVNAFAAILGTARLDRALVAESLSLPGESYLADGMRPIDVDAIHASRQWLRRTIAERLEDELRSAYRANSSNAPYRFEPESAGRRSLKNVCLDYLMELRAEDVREMCHAQLRDADNMTEALAALACIAADHGPGRDDALGWFEERWRDDPLVMDKWLAIQAMSPLPGTLERVRALLDHPAFDLRNPNRVRALLGAFCQGNPVRFHAASGEGYRFAAEQIVAIDRINPQVSARLLGAFSRWRRMDPARTALMGAELERILATPRLSKDAFEIASKTYA